MWNSIPVWHRKIHICNLCTELKSLSKIVRYVHHGATEKYSFRSACKKDGRKNLLTKFPYDVFLDVSIFTSRIGPKYTHWFLRHLDITFPLFPMSNN